MPIKSIDANTLNDWLSKGEAVLIDVREPAEYASSCIKHSTLIPLSNLSLSSLPAIKGKKLVLHCKAGKRGQNGCEKLLAEDSNLEIYNLAGGLSAWEGSGLPVSSGTRRVLPLDQQVQITIGLFVLTGSVLGYYSNPLFFLLSGFFGAGLIFAGISGFCGLARLMAKMPWNRA